MSGTITADTNLKLNVISQSKTIPQRLAFGGLEQLGLREKDFVKDGRVRIVRTSIRTIRIHYLDDPDGSPFHGFADVERDRTALSLIDHANRYLAGINPDGFVDVKFYDANRAYPIIEGILYRRKLRRI